MTKHGTDKLASLSKDVNKNEKVCQSVGPLREVAKQLINVYVSIYKTPCANRTRKRRRLCKTKNALFSGEKKKN